MTPVKLVVSDFHLGTGLVGPDGSRNLMEDFVFDDRFVEFLDHYMQGKYAEREVELVVNGDFFNLLQVDYEGSVPSDVTEEIAVAQLADVLDGHPETCAALARFAEAPGHVLTFMVGNHDAGLIFPAAQALLKARVSEKIIIRGEPYLFDGVRIEHGDRHEPVHEIDEPFYTPSGGKTLLNLPWASYFFIHFVRPLKYRRAYIDKVKPFRTYLTWAALFDFRFFLSTVFRLVYFWIYSIGWGRIGSRRFGPTILPVFLRQIEGHNELRAARRLLFRERKLNTVILGHTHHALYRQFAPGREYFNTGCWNQVTDLDIEGYGWRVRLTYAFLEYSEKERRWLTRLLVWNGQQHLHEPFWG